MYAKCLHTSSYSNYSRAIPGIKASKISNQSMGIVGFHTVLGVIDPGGNRFCPRVVGVVSGRNCNKGMGTYLPKCDGSSTLCMWVVRLFIGFPLRLFMSKLLSAF